MLVKILTLFPQLYPGPLGISLCGLALQKKIWELDVIDIRDYANNKHNKVDDAPFGGGKGMILKADILENAILGATNNSPKNYTILYPSPRGFLLNQKKTVEFAKKTNILILCGRYEGIDQRIIDKYNIVEYSIGDYVLSGGEIASYAIIDAIVRLLPGVLESSARENESFGICPEYENLLEYPLYTRPRSWNGLEVPDVLISGNHQEIKKWQLKEAKKITQERRPDLWRIFCKKNLMDSKDD